MLVLYNPLITCDSICIPKLLSQVFICYMGKLWSMLNIPVGIYKKALIWRLLAYKYKDELNLLFFFRMFLWSCFMPCQYTCLPENEACILQKFYMLFYPAVTQNYPEKRSLIPLGMSKEKLIITKSEIMQYIKIHNVFEIIYVYQRSFLSIFVPLFHSLHFYFFLMGHF